MSRCPCRGPLEAAAPAEIFHEILEHRWYMSETAGRDVGTTAAARSYFKRILPGAPEPMDQASGAPAAHEANDGTGDGADDGTGDGGNDGAGDGTGDRQPMEADASSE